jgi:glycosidase
MNKKFHHYFLAISLVTSLFACQSPKKNEEIQKPFYAPEWSKNAVIYEVNVRQHSKDGSFNSVTQDIPRIKNLGADILWLMPIHPIGKKNRKGGLGSYYSVQDYQGINPEYGNLEDFKKLVKTAHDHGMKVIIDWVANHTAWDNQWIIDHPEWYAKDTAGNIVTPWDWTDVAKLNFENKELRKAMIESMEYWIKEADIDGFRCDVAFMVPADFWKEARAKLEKTKPVFMLAEMEAQTEISKDFKAYYENAFNANYAWAFHGTAHEVAKGKKSVADFMKYLDENYKQIPQDVFKMHFITNHDENTWNGTIDEKFGNQWKKWSMLCYTLPQSLPLIYSGQEANNTKRLEFFEKDPIIWGDTSQYAWYRKMNHIKHSYSALDNGTWGANTNWLKLPQELENKVIAFERINNDGNGVLILANLTNEKIDCTTLVTPNSSFIKQVLVSENVDFAKTQSVPTILKDATSFVLIEIQK